MTRYSLADESIRGKKRGKRWVFMHVDGDEAELLATMRSVRSGDAGEERYGGKSSSVTLVALNAAGEVVAGSCNA